MRIFWQVLTLSIIYFPSFAILHSLPEATEFYRSQTSTFPSGETSRDVLEKNIVSTQVSESFLVNYKNQQYNISPNKLITETRTLGLGVIKNNGSLYEKDNLNSEVISKVKQGESVTLLKFQNGWVQVISQKSIGWVEEKQISGANSDIGVWLTGKDTYLKKLPNQKSKVLTTIPRLTRLENTKLINGWVKINYQDTIGFIPAHELIHRSDFALWAYHPKKSWVNVVTRSHQFIITNSGDKIPLSQLQGYVSHPNKKILVNAQGLNIPLLTKLEVVGKIKTEWANSNLSGHGSIWWIRENQDSKNIHSSQSRSVATQTYETVDNDSEYSFSIQQILNKKKKIFSYDFSDKYLIRGITSADGIYISKNGYKWKKITTLDQTPRAVLIHPSGSLIAGEYISTDSGETFKPYIKWDMLTEAIQKSTGRPPRHIIIEKISSPSASQVQLRVDTGTYKLNLQSHLNLNNWAIIK